MAAVAAEARRATRVRQATAMQAHAGGADQQSCVICIGPVVAPVELPCGHAYCGACLKGLRAKGVARVCPLCRAELPPGVVRLFDLAWRAYKRIEGLVKRGDKAWDALSVEEQKELDDIVVT